MGATHLISARPAVRVRPVPPLEPPFDDERSPGAWWREAAGQLALDLPVTPGSSARDGGTGDGATADGATGDGARAMPAAGRHPTTANRTMTTGPRTTGPRTTTGRGAPGPLAAGRGTAGPGTARPGAEAYARSLRRLPPEALVTAGGEAHQAARRILACCMEIIDGHRPIGHVRRLSEAADHAILVGQLTAAVRRLARPPTSGQRAGGLRVRVLRVSEPQPGGVEVTAVIGRGDRSWALAMRIDRGRAGWRATRINLL